MRLPVQPLRGMEVLRVVLRSLPGSQLEGERDSQESSSIDLSSGTAAQPALLEEPPLAGQQENNVEVRIRSQTRIRL